MSEKGRSQVVVPDDIAKHWIANLFQSGRYASQYLWLLTFIAVAWYFGTATPDKPGAEAVIRFTCALVFPVSFVALFVVWTIDLLEKRKSPSHRGAEAHNVPVGQGNEPGVEPAGADDRPIIPGLIVAPGAGRSDPTRDNALDKLVLPKTDPVPASRKGKKRPGASPPAP
jgi:hypothetical protein